MKTTLAGLALAAFGISSAGAQSMVVSKCGNLPTPLVVGATNQPDTIDTNGNKCVNLSVSLPGVPFSKTAPGGNTQISLLIEPPAGQYAYITDFAITGNGASNPSVAVTNYFNMSGGIGPNVLSFDALVISSASQQIDFHRSYSYPWQSASPGQPVTIVLAPLGAGNTAITMRAVGYFQ